MMGSAKEGGVLMFKTFDRDRPVIERKFHDPDQPFNPYRRMAYHGYDFDPATGDTDEEILAGLQAHAAEWADLPHPVARARATAYVLAHTRIDVNDSDYFVGVYSLNRLGDSVTFKPWKAAVYDEKIPEIRDAMEVLTRNAVDIWPDFDHVVPDWDSILSLGFPGLKERAAAYRARREQTKGLTEKERAFFDGIDEELAAILAFLDRLIALAKTKTGEKAPRVLSALEHLREGAPQNFFDALELMWLYFIISECIGHYQVRSLGNGLDHSLRPFYEKDLREGVFTRDEIREFLAYFMMQWSAIGNYWGQPLYLGGTDADGTCRVCDLTRDIVEVRREIGIYNPKIQIKVDENTPPDFLELVFDAIRAGNGSYVFCCEPGYRRAIMSYGAAADEALDFDIRGCYESGVRANEVCTATGYINVTKAVLYALRDGVDEMTGERAGVSTGPVEEMRSFDDLYAAVLKQLDHLIEETIRCSRGYDPYLGEINPSNLYSATVEHSLACARDGYQDGVKFNNSAVLCCGLASMVDSLLAIRDVVFERKLATLRELVRALDDDFRGHEALRAALLKTPHHYGNGDPVADEMARGVSDYFTARVNGRRNGRGGLYKALLHSAMQFLRQGRKTGATPDGRLAGEELSKNGSPAIGRDRNGVTALIRSVLALTPANWPEACCVDLVLHPSAVQGKDGLLAMKALLDVYRKNGGLALQFNLFDAAALRDAQEHPEKYQNLQVRVCGWNVLWNNLSRPEQDAYIARAEAL